MKITLTGDSLFSSTNLSQRLSPEIVQRLAESDVNFTNAEFATPSPDTSPAAGRGYTTAVEQNRLDELVNLNFNLVNFANNHSGDFGIQGMLDTYHAAKKRGLQPLGLGRSLDEAIKPHFIDTPTGRVGIVSTTATRADIFLASNAGNGVPARPGVNPLRWSETYVVDATKFEQLEQINEALETAHSQRVGTEIERWEALDDQHLYLGSMYQDKLLVEKGDHNYVKTTPNRHDLETIKRQVADAKRRADFVIFAVHTHEGESENWYADAPATFMRQVAHEVIDAGADVVVGHGAHFLRTIENYHGKPIFYNLGSFLMEFEAGESMIPPEMYEAYHLPVNAVPSALHSARAQDQAGHLVGFNGDLLFSEGLMVQVTVDEGQVHYFLYPTNLRLQDRRNLNRGLPVPADQKWGQQIMQRLQRLNPHADSQWSYDYQTHELTLL